LSNYNLPSTVLVDGEEPQTVENVLEDYNKWHSKYETFAQGRTNFQIEKFVSLEDGTPVYNYVNVLYQTRVMRGELMREVKRGVELQRSFAYLWDNHEDKHVPIIIKDEQGNDKLIWYDLEKLDHDLTLAELKLSIKDKLQQLSTYNAILAQLEENNGGEFTKEQYEQEAPEYWEKRFERQAVDDLISARLGMSTGNVKSIRQGLAKPILKNSPNQIKDGSLVETLISGEFELLETIQQSNQSMKELYDSMSRKNFAIEHKKQEVKQVTKTETKKDAYDLDEEALAALGIHVAGKE
jgi:hypothetical protein